MIDIEEVKDLSDGMVDKIINRLGAKVESRHGREQNGTHPACLEHELDVALVERGFPDHQNELPPLFQGYIGCPGQEVVIIGMGNSGKRFNGTGNDHHPIGLEGAT